MARHDTQRPAPATTPIERVDVVVVGGGLAGLSAARRVHAAGRSVAVITEAPGSLPYTSGALDLLAVYPTETKRYRPQPWEALAELVEREPGHPYAKVGLGTVRRAWKEAMTYLAAGPLRYHHHPSENLAICTVAGTIKPTYAVPATLQGNAEAWQQRRPTVVVGFDRFADFYPEQVVGNLRARWPGLRALRLETEALLPANGRVTAAALAAELEHAAFRSTLGELLRPRLEGARFVGLPSVLGYGNATQICDDLSEQLDATVFEIPLLSPCFPGMRLAELLKGDLWNAGVRVWQGAPVRAIEEHGHRVTAVLRQGRTTVRRVEAAAFVLATGRFFGGGLEATPRGVRECLVNLPVSAPRQRDDWHMNTFLGAPGHPINRVGVEVDERLRPLDAHGRPRFHNLFVAGALLAGHDWVREKSGAGISIATGFAAAESALASLRSRP